MSEKDYKLEKARFDVRILKEQKILFERAAQLGGYRSLTEFLVSTAQEKAKTIIAEKEQIIASEKDREIFFDTLMNPPVANAALVKAAKKYKDQLSE